MAPPLLRRRHKRPHRSPAPSLRTPRSIVAVPFVLPLIATFVVLPIAPAFSFAPPSRVGGRLAAPPRLLRPRSTTPPSSPSSSIAAPRRDASSRADDLEGTQNATNVGLEGLLILPPDGGTPELGGSSYPSVRSYEGRRFASDVSPVRAFERTMRENFKLKDYRFGDITRGAVSKAKGDLEEAMKTATGNSSYRFGDLTKWELSKLSRDADVHELVKMAGLFWREGLTPRQKRDVWMIVLYLGASIFLAYNAISNLQLGATFAVAWTSASRSAGASPLAPGIWPFFLQRHATISLGASAALLCPVRVVMVVPWFFQYRRTIAWMEGKIGLRDKFPLLNRVMAVAVTWVVANVAAVVLLTSVLIWIGSLWTGIPVFPLAP